MNESYISLWAKNALQSLGKPSRHSARYLILLAEQAETRRSIASQGGKPIKALGRVDQPTGNAPARTLFRRRLRN